MSGQILTAILIAAALFVLFTLFQKYFPLNKEAFEIPAAAPPISLGPPYVPEQILAPSGPSAPAAAPPLERRVPQPRIPGPDDSDPFDEKYGSSDVQENMRYPERSFHKVESGQNGQISVESGVAGDEQQVVSNSLQTFSPDFAQNGGEFLPGGIFANDTTENPNYSSI